MERKTIEKRQFVLRINLGNDAMLAPNDIARSLKQVVRIQASEQPVLTISDMWANTTNLYDGNGNQVGFFEVI